ncbi:hypothetical protein V9T40_009092 [Parthenolecanium corni]|uniref:Uncharacterized protein n=1 Tax=Parthenolecanium corni TaxID=536013 RepID=A0AAN9TRM6_9HEMI
MLILLYSSDEDALLRENFEEAFAEAGHLASWESSKIRLASFPDNIITKNVVDKILRTKKLRSKCGCASFHQNDSSYPVTTTYHFSTRPFLNEDSDNERDYADSSNDFQGKSDEYEDSEPNYPFLRDNFKQNKFFFNKYSA